MVMRVAWELGKFEDEILSMDPDEFSHWVAFFKIQADELKKK